MSRYHPGALLSRLGISYDTSGIKLVAICPSPDHNDTKPSWVMFADGPRRGKHRCLSCGFAGGPAKLVMAVLGVDWDEALRLLESDELTAPPRTSVDVLVREPATGRRAVRVPSGVVVAPLSDWPSPPRKYVEERDVTADQVEAWGMGYAVDGTCGGRVWIPVHSTDGSLAAWTARSYGNRTPKYWSASASDNADDGVLLGELMWPLSVRNKRLGAVVLVEGPFDGFAIDRAEQRFGVLRGSDFDPRHAMRIATWESAVLAFDPDKAGEKVRQLITGISRHVRLSHLRWPDGHDAASLAEEDFVRFASLVDGAVKDATLAIP